MIEAITYKYMKDELLRKYRGRNKTIAILLVKPNKSQSSEEILNNISYFHQRSEDKLDIFLPGYGAYWGDSIPDSINVCRVDYTDWSFSNKHYVEFIKKLETISKFKYSGGSELILIDFVDKDLSFEKVVRVKLERALRDEAIDSIEEFIENVISRFIKSTNTYEVSDTLTLKELGKSIGSELKQKFAVYRMFTRSRHYIINNYKK
ncbi:hypothetical protein [Fusibacter bizertensis]